MYMVLTASMNTVCHLQMLKYCIFCNMQLGKEYHLHESACMLSAETSGHILKNLCLSIKEKKYFSNNKYQYILPQV